MSPGYYGLSLVSHRSRARRTWATSSCTWPTTPSTCTAATSSTRTARAPAASARCPACCTGWRPKAWTSRRCGPTSSRSSSRPPSPWCPSSESTIRPTSRPGNRDPRASRWEAGDVHISRSFFVFKRSYFFSNIKLLLLHAQPHFSFQKNSVQLFMNTYLYTGFVRSWKTWKCHGIIKWLLFTGLEKSLEKN